MMGKSSFRIVDHANAGSLSREMANGYISVGSSAVLYGKKSIWVHNPCLPGVPKVVGNPYVYIAPAFSGSLLWGGINMATPALLARGGVSWGGSTMGA